MTAAIVAENLYKSFNEVHAVNGLSLTVQEGEIYGLVGPDGAGKTTTMRLICGGFHADQGSVSIRGLDVAKHPEEARAQIGYLAQRFSLYADLTVMENLRFFAEMHSLKSTEWKERTQEILEFVGLAEFSDRLADQLSGGMKQKLGLATALVHRPKVLLLDEPTGGVDPVARQEFWHLLIGLLRGGSAVLVSTPYMDEAMRFNRVIFMNKGRALTDGAPRDLLHRLDGLVLELAAKPQMEARRLAALDPDVEDVHAFGDKLHLRVTHPEEPLARLPGALAAADVRLIYLRPVSPTLEDVFIQLLEMDENDQQPLADH